MQNFSFKLIVGATVLFVLFTSIFAQNKGFDVTRMDKTVDACTDFFQYANGTWLKNTEIPAAYSRWGSFNILNEFTQNAVNSILEEVSKTSGAKGSPEQMVGDFYASGMNTNAIESLGIGAITPQLNTINAINSLLTNNIFSFSLRSVF